MQATEVTMQVGKQPDAGYRSLETEDEHVLFESTFAHYRSSPFATPTPCVVLLVEYKRKKEVHIVLRDQSSITLATFEVGDSHPHPRPVCNFTHIGDQKIEFATAREAMTICAMADAAVEYIFHCQRNDDEQTTLLVLLLLFALKNGYTEVVEQTLRDHSPHDLTPKTTLSPENLTTAIWREASQLATLQPNRTGLLRSIVFWAMKAKNKTLAIQLMELLKGIIVGEDEVLRWADLSWAATGGRSDMVMFILSENGTTLYSEGHLAFYLAAGYGRLGLVQELLMKGVVDDYRTYYRTERTALDCAAAGGHLMVVETIIEASGNVDILSLIDRCSALTWAASKGHLAVVQALLKAGADLNDPLGSGGVALRSAAGGGHKLVVEFLLKAGVDVNAGPGSVRTALQAAAEYGHSVVVELLLKAGPDVNASSKGNLPPLQRAAGSGHGVVVELLLKAGADVNAPPWGGRTPLHCAAGRSNRAVVVELLLKAGADVNAPPGEYSTTLQCAAICGDVAALELLLNAGADVDAPAGKDGTALQCARGEGHKGEVELLLKRGAIDE